MPIVNRVADLATDIAAWRQDIHEHPELLYEVHRTAGLVAERLKEFGCDEVATGLGGTGVVGVIKGRKPAGNGDVRTIGLRADMDALPIEQATGLPYASRTSGKMHACGHDGHTAMLLGAARYLAETRNFAGDAIVIFQPAEEGGAGAAAMIKDGLFERFTIDQVYGMHNGPGIPVGSFAIRPGRQVPGVPGRHPGPGPDRRFGLRRGTRATAWYDAGCRLETADRPAAAARSTGRRRRRRSGRTRTARTARANSRCRAHRRGRRRPSRRGW